MCNINNFTAVCAKYVHFTLHLLSTSRYVLNIAQMAIALLFLHGDRPHNYVSNDISGFAVSPGLTKILPIEKCIIFRELSLTSFLRLWYSIGAGVIGPSVPLARLSHLNVIPFTQYACVVVLMICIYNLHEVDILTSGLSVLVNMVQCRTWLFKAVIHWEVKAR